MVNCGAHHKSLPESYGSQVSDHFTLSYSLKKSHIEKSKKQSALHVHSPVASRSMACKRRWNSCTYEITPSGWAHQALIPEVSIGNLHQVAFRITHRKKTPRLAGARRSLELCLGSHTQTAHIQTWNLLKSEGLYRQPRLTNQLSRFACLQADPWTLVCWTHFGVCCY